ncbi:ABC transporter permease [Rugosimonospora africana]|uniref:Transport permease protein n=1 Tax=Rugosimonospora africana TaxID=556532 RepID=A0A8J3QX03_9ACTN|nr:ABC transporter permease [Rugosimonospora africana]GIH18091.1 transport permease protein [Rugosimonospora africana]
MTALRWYASDVWTLTRRDLAHWLARPGVAAVSWLFPIMILLMFGGLFGGAIGGPSGRYFEFLVPGMLALTVVFGLETTVTAVATDAAKGVTDRLRSMPTNASAVVAGRCLADLANSVLGLGILVLAGLAVGWRWNHGLVAALGALCLLVLLRFALLWLGIYLGLVVKGPESVAAVQILVWPVAFLSGVFVDPTTMPSWLGAIASWNPLSTTASAVRELSGSPGWGADSYAARHAVLVAVASALVLTAVFLPLSARRYRRLAA